MPGVTTVLRPPPAMRTKVSSSSAEGRAPRLSRWLTMSETRPATTMPITPSTSARKAWSGSACSDDPTTSTIASPVKVA